MNYKILENVNYSKVQTFDVKQNGIQIIEDENKLEIYNDPFRTTPLFIVKNINDELIIFSNFEDFYKMDNIDKAIDEAGFWEIVLFGSGLWTRTLYNNVKQMPAASKIVINRNKNDYTIERYWDFDIKEDKSIDSIEKAAKGLYNRLDNVFSKLDITQKYVMGMSGGMDSRITLAFLSKYIPKENLELFTYGFDKRLLEYKYACEVATAFRYNKPKFHKLTKKSYQAAMSYLPKMSGGQICINHCHITSFLREHNLEEYKQISTYYSDAILGWDSKENKFIDKIESNFYVKTLIKFDFLTEDIKSTIENDSYKIFNKIKEEYNYCSLDEYKYVTERNQKFHNYMASIQNRFLNTILPFASYELFSYAQSIPLKYKCEKQLIDYILENYFNLKDMKNISSRFQWGSRFSNIKEWYSFKFLNRANAILRPFTKGQIQLFNKYQTEEQDRLLYRDFHKELKESTQKFVNLGLMNEEQKKEWDKLPLKSKGISERYHLISLGKLID